LKLPATSCREASTVRSSANFLIRSLTPQPRWRDLRYATASCGECARCAVQIVISPEILDEYHRVGKELSARFSMVDLDPILKLIIAKAELIEAASLDEAVCDDPDDDKFFAGAIAGEVMLIVSGDKHLIKMSGYQGIEVIRPRQFVDKYL